jgi:hypothetical protein
LVPHQLRGLVPIALLVFASSAAITADVTPALRRAAPALLPASGIATVSPVTDAMLAKPPPQDWLMWRGTLMDDDRRVPIYR